MDEKYQIKKGTMIILEGEYYVCLRKISGGRYQFEAMENGELRNLSHEDLAKLISLGKAELNVSPLLMDADKILTENETKAATRRLSYLRVFDEAKIKCPTYPKYSAKSKRLIEEVAQLIDDPNPPSRKTVYNWIIETNGRRTLNGVAPANSRKGRQGDKIFDRCPDLLDLMEACAKEFYLRSERPTIKQLRGDLLDAIIIHNNTVEPPEQLPSPNYEAVRRYIASLDLYESALARLGKIHANSRFKRVKHIPKPSRPMQVLELDATQLDIIVTLYGFKIRRPWLTVVIDLYTRMIVGFHLSTSAPSTQTVAETLRNALHHKYYLDNIPKLKNPWPCYGKPLMLIVDRGKENMSDDLMQMGNDLDLVIQQLPGRSPWLKGTVERFFRSLNQGLIHSLTGTTKSNPKDRGEYDSEKKAKIELKELYNYLHRWIIDVYHTRYHMGIHDIPLRRWQSYKHPIPLFESNKQIRFWTMRTLTRTLSREGIKIDYLFFDSDEVNEWRRDSRVNKPRNKGDTAEVKVKYSDSEIFDNITVLHPVDGYPVIVPVIEEQRDLVKDLTRLQYNTIRKLARQKLNIKKANDEATITEAAILKEAYAIKRRRPDLFFGKDKLTRQDTKLLVSNESSSGDEIRYPTVGPALTGKDDEDIDWIDFDPY